MREPKTKGGGHARDHYGSSSAPSSASPSASSSPASWPTRPPSVRRKRPNPWWPTRSDRPRRCAARPIVEAKDEALKLKQEAQAENKERLREVRAAENRVSQREESLDRRVESLDAREHQISSQQGQLDRRERDLDAAEREVDRRLERAAGMTPEEAKAELLDTLKDEVAHESAAIIRDAEARAKAEADKKARSILSLAIQRVAADHSAETTVSAIHIPSDDLKGRIIGREGRNIRSFEQLTGTNLIIDDTPGVRDHLVLRPGAPRDRPRDHGEPRGRRAHPPGAHRGDVRQGRGVREPARAGGGRAGRLRHGHPRSASRARAHARPPALPHLLRPERAEPLARGGLPLGRHGRGAGA